MILGLGAVSGSWFSIRREMEFVTERYMSQNAGTLVTDTSTKPKTELNFGRTLKSNSDNTFAVHDGARRNRPDQNKPGAMESGVVDNFHLSSEP